MPTKTLTALDPPEPGIYDDVPAEVYHRWRAANHSFLVKANEESWAQARYEMENPEASTRAMIRGTAGHMLILQPMIFEDHYKRAIEGDGRKKEIKDARARQAKQFPNATILPADDYDNIHGARDSILAHPDAPALIGGRPELSIVWKDEMTGVLCKARFDDVADDVGCATDVKLLKDVRPFEFNKALNRGYHIQAAHYLEGAKAVELDVRWFMFLCCRPTPVYPVFIYRATQRTLLAGSNERDYLMKQYARCVKTGVWPGVPAGIEDAEVADWKFEEAMRKGEAA